MALSDIEVRDLPSQHTAVVRHRISMQEVQRIPGWIRETYEAVQRAGQQPAGMPFVRTLDMSGGTMEVEVGWPVAAPFGGDGDVHAGTLPGGTAAVASYFGPYEQIGPAYQAIVAWCAEHGHAVAGAPWESYVTDPHEEPDSSKWRTDIHFPVQG
ncbi:MAG: GyrI-like domain-containing protein [Dehalococcoidia bacterium]